MWGARPLQNPSIGSPFVVRYLRDSIPLGPSSFDPPHPPKYDKTKHKSGALTGKYGNGARSDRPLSFPADSCTVKTTPTITKGHSRGGSLRVSRVDEPLIRMIAAAQDRRKRRTLVSPSVNSRRPRHERGPSIGLITLAPS